MNVMAEAHKATKEFFASVTETGLTYRVVLKIKLRVKHGEYKAMNVSKKWQDKIIADAKARIAELEAIEHTDGFIVVIGDSIRLPMNETQGKWTNVEKASIFWYREDAQRFAGRIVNGNNEVGQVVKKIDQIKWEIEEQQKLIESMK